MTFISQTIDSAMLNLSISFPDLIIFLIVLCCIIIFALGLRIGLMFSTVTLGFFYVIFSLNSMPTNNILMIFFISLVMLALSFFVKTTHPGAV